MTNLQLARSLGNTLGRYYGENKGKVSERRVDGFFYILHGLAFTISQKAADAFENSFREAKETFSR